MFDDFSYIYKIGRRIRERNMFCSTLYNLKRVAKFPTSCKREGNVLGRRFYADCGDAFLRKPYSMAELAMVVRRELDR